MLNGPLSRRFLLTAPLMALMSTACAQSTSTIVGVNGVAVDLTITVGQDDGMGLPSAGSETLQLEPGGTASLGALGTNAVGMPVSGVTVVWASSNAAVASVSADGVVTAVAIGTAEIEATADEVSASITVVVSDPTP